jgi:pyruvate, water dikinase
MSEKQEWKIITELLKYTDPILINRLGRKMMHYLYKCHIKRIEELMKEIEANSNSYAENKVKNDNVPIPRVEADFLQQMIERVFQIAEEELSSERITQMIKLWLKHEKARFLTMTAEKRDVPLADITNAVFKFASVKDSVSYLSKEENIGIRVAFIRRFLSDDLHFINTSKDYFVVPDFIDILSHTIGPRRGNGKLGGKAAGFLRARNILREAKKDYVSIRNLAIPKTWYLTSDGIIDFLHFNALEEAPNIKYRKPIEIKQEYPYLEQIFKNSTIPPEIVASLNYALDDLGENPLIVRSSSLLEDSSNASFAGKYKSLFVANQGTKKERLESLIDAILEVYASVFGPDPIEYRREKGLLDFNEEMAVLIQEVVGRKIGKYFFPAFAGVAFSQNEFRWSPRIKREDGIARIVAGLGTRAVDRVDNDYPALISPGQPNLRVNVDAQDKLRYSQRNIDVINLLSKQFETLSFEKLIREVGYNYPSINQIISLYRDGNLFTPTGNMFNIHEDTPIVTFDRLLKDGPFIHQIRDILSILQEKLEIPVDIEFACDGDIHKLYLLQCRPQSYIKFSQEIHIPKNIPDDKILFSNHQTISSGEIFGIEYIVYIDPVEYGNLPSYEGLLEIGKIVGKLNQVLPRRKFILIGPGRWGSRGDIKLGVSIGYSDINNTALLVEVAKMQQNYVPELSFGTHFFQDLVEAQIQYLPIYIGQEQTIFHEEFFQQNNVLKKLVPDAGKYDSVVRVIHISQQMPEQTLTILMDEEEAKAVGFFQP